MKVEIHGHRGSRGTHPENTIPSFEEAVAVHADYFELDVHLSHDDEVIVFHDPAISARVCTGVEMPLPLRSLKASEITAYDCGSVPQPKFPHQRLLKGTRIPTLDDVLSWLSSAKTTTGVNIEMKMEALSAEMMPDRVLFTAKVLEVVHRYKLLDRTLLQSFDFSPLVEARKREPRLRISCLFDNPADFAAAALATGANAVGPRFGLLDAANVKACHAKGIQVIPWTVNEPADWDRLVAMGVDGIITDYPRQLKAHLVRA